MEIVLGSGPRDLNAKFKNDNPHVITSKQPNQASHQSKIGAVALLSGIAFGEDAEISNGANGDGASSIISGEGDDVKTSLKLLVNNGQVALYEKPSQIALPVLNMGSPPEQQISQSVQKQKGISSSPSNSEPIDVTEVGQPSLVRFALLPAEAFSEMQTYRKSNAPQNGVPCITVLNKMGRPQGRVIHSGFTEFHVSHQLTKDKALVKCDLGLYMCKLVSGLNRICADPENRVLYLILPE